MVSWLAEMKGRLVVVRRDPKGSTSIQFITIKLQPDDCSPVSGSRELDL
jgi:hypothetical protein